MSAAEMREALKPCPFCGREAEIERDNDHHGGWFNLGCSRHWGRVDPDKACVAGRLFYTAEPETLEASVSAWNRRAPLPNEEGMVETLERVRLVIAREHCAEPCAPASIPAMGCPCESAARAALRAINGGEP